MVETSALGHRTWLIADGFIPTGEADGLESHEAICLLNTGQGPARVQVTAYLEDDDPLGPFLIEVPARRTRHVHVHALRDAAGASIPRDVPYALLLTSDVPVCVQHSRLDVRSANMALMTTMAHPVSPR
jgi:hypothetical protein